MENSLTIQPVKALIKTPLSDQLLRGWQELKYRLDRIDEKEFDRLGEFYQPGELVGGLNLDTSIGYHLYGKERHETTKEKRVIEGGEGKDYSVELIWCICPKCKEARYKKIMAWNNLDNTAYCKILIDRTIQQ